MKCLYYFYILLFALCCFTSCEKKNDSLLITSTTQLTFDSDGGSQSFNIASNTDWSISSNAEWLTVSPAMGSGNQQVTITVAVSDNQLEKDAKLVVHTIDGEKIVNINVKVEGSYVRTGKHLDIRNHISRLFLGGKAHTIDSLQIRSNIAWEVKGPEWIEAWDGVHWRPLSKERGVIKGSGMDYVYIRTARDNIDEEDWEDIITISEQFTGEFSLSLNVEQMGRLQARYNYVAILADGFAFGWIVGCDVEKIYFRVTDQEEPRPFNEEIRQTYDVTTPDYINSADSLRANSTFYISCVCEDSLGNMGKHRQTYTALTYNGQAQPVASINNVWKEKGQWQISIIPDEDATKFWLYTTTNKESAFAYNNPILRYLFFENLRHVANACSGEGLKEVPALSNEIHVMTWASAGGTMSNYITRYDRYYDENGNELPPPPLLDRIPKAMVKDIRLR